MKIKIENKFKAVLAAALFFISSVSQAQVSLDITGGVVRGKPIAIVPFRVVDGSQILTNIDQVVADDLSATGKFEPLSSKNYLAFPSRHEEVRFKDWRFIDAEALVIGEILKIAPDQYEVSYRMYDVAREVEVGYARRFVNVPEKDLRKVAHSISDSIYQAFLGRPGAFSSRIAFIKRSEVEYKRYRYSLMVADWDGYGAQEAFGSWNPVLSPTWSPDGNKLALVSLSKKGPIVKVIELNTGKQSVVADFKGVNAAPAWSPDGTKLAYSTSKNGSPDVYVYDFATGSHQRITTHYGIDTEPSWSPDGQSLLFTSNRSGRPQVYGYNFNNQEVYRLTFEGKENANGQYDYNANRMVYVTNGGEIAVMDAKTNGITSITQAKFDESPSFSPNGDMVLYASEEGYQPALMVASSDGRVRTRLKFVSGDVREPAWSPLK